MFRPIFAHLQERKTEIFTEYGIVSCCCGRPGFGERQRGTTCTVWRKLLDESSNFLHTVHVVPRCRSPNPGLPQQQDTIPYAVKISILRSWRWTKDCPKHVKLILEINKLLLLHLVGFSILLYLHWWCTVKQKSRMMKWAVQVARTGNRGNVHRILVGKSEGRRPPEQLGVDGTITLKETWN